MISTTTSFPPAAYDVAVVGAGPGGGACAALCAQAGLRTLLLERSVFPREKVCGDCLNPNCWPSFDRLGVSSLVESLPHSRLAAVEFVAATGRVLRVELPASGRGEIAVKRSALDALLLDHARKFGAEVREGAPLSRLSRTDSGWALQAGDTAFAARVVVAADGRNSTVARLLGLLPAARKDRLALQTHLPAPPGFGHKVALHLRADGYCGVASIGAGQLNLCLVAVPSKMPGLKAWAAQRFGAVPEESWTATAPLARAPVSPAQPGLLLVGDAARVVEPFTGEGISYALASGVLAADAIVAKDLPSFAARHRTLYQGRLWWNQLAKAAVLHPWLGAQTLRLSHLFPGLLHSLTTKVLARPQERSPSEAHPPH